MKTKTYHKRKLVQIAIGVIMIIASVLLLAVCATGTTPQDKDATFAIVTITLGLYCIFAKEVFIDF